MKEIEAELRTLMIASLSGDKAAYRQLLRSSADRIRKYFSRRLGTGAAEVEDLVQETLMAIHQRRGSYDKSQPYTAWLHAIARYKLIDYYRRNAVRKTVSVNDFEDFLVGDTVEQAMAAHDVADLLSRLPGKQRDAIQLTRIDGYSVAEASAVSGQSESAIKVGVHRGMKKLLALVRGFERQ